MLSRLEREAQRSLAPFTPPEILTADLAPLALELAAGVRAMPPIYSGSTRRRLPCLASARDLLARLGAIDADGRITAHGREMARR